jgi:hypothetical protein
LVDVGDLTAATSGREAARPFYDRALAISAARRGADHPDTTSLADHVRDLLDQPTWTPASESNQRNRWPINPTP